MRGKEKGGEGRYVCKERGNKMKDLSLITTGKGVVGCDSGTKGRGGASLGKKSLTSCL